MMIIVEVWKGDVVEGEKRAFQIIVTTGMDEEVSKLLYDAVVGNPLEYDEEMSEKITLEMEEMLNSEDFDD